MRGQRCRKQRVADAAERVAVGIRRLHEQRVSRALAWRLNRVLRGRFRPGQAATAQLAAGTQTYLEVQSLRSWAGAGGDNFRRDTLYLRAISPYWPRNIFPP